MSKKEFVELYAKKTNSTKRKAEELVNLFLETVEDSLSEGKEVKFIGWGTFSLKERKKREGVNSLTKKKMVIPAKTVVKFRVGKSLAEKVNKK